MVARLGIFGGTFDPIHNGHIVAALAAREQLQLDEVVMMVAADPWQKRGAVSASANARLELVRVACADVDGLRASGMEILRGGPTYTFDTVEAMRAQAIADAADSARTAETGSGAEAGAVPEIVVILGADTASRVDAWHRAHELAQSVSLAVVTRAGTPLELDHLSSAWTIVAVAMPALEISSTDIRQRIRAGRSIAGLVPSEVVRGIRSASLYTSEL